MRQVGILCAAALYALEHHRARLADDHANARRLAAGLAGIAGVRVDADKIETNIVIFEVTGVPSAELARRTEASGVRLHAIAPTRLRAVTHLDVDAAGIDRAIAAVRAALVGLTEWTRPPKRPPAADAEELKRLGYAQELRRRMGAFSNFAISFSTICILAGGITSLQLGLSAIGGAAAGIVWPVGVAFSLIVALCMAEVASAFPDRRRALSLELDPRRQGVGLGDRLVQPGRPRVRHRRRQRRRVRPVRALRRADGRDRSHAPRHGPPDRGRRADLAVARAAEPLRDPRDDAAHRLFRLVDLRRRAAC